MRILLVEGDAECALNLSQGLQAVGHKVVISPDGRDGLFQAISYDWDLLIADRVLTGLDGLEMLLNLRSRGIETPLMFLTALGGVEHCVRGLNAGADDYLVKPVDLSELTARVAVLGRRLRRVTHDIHLKVAGLEMDLLAHTVERGGQRIVLKPLEFRSLEFLMRNADQIVTRTMLLGRVWGIHFDPCTNIVESHISRLRGKIDKGHTVRLISTVRGAGYCLRGAV